MGRLNKFATMAARGELPDWYYYLISSTKMVPVVKRHDPDAPGPEVRPVQVGDPLIATTWKTIMAEMGEKMEGILRPQQVAVGVKGGLSILVHGVRAMLQQSPGLVVVKLDLRNAFNDVDRAELVRAVRSHHELGDILPLMVNTYVPETVAVMGRDCESLFSEGEERGDVSTGGPQGNPLMGSAFCLAIHPFVKKLHERLLEGGEGHPLIWMMAMLWAHLVKSSRRWRNLRSVSVTLGCTCVLTSLSYTP